LIGLVIDFINSCPDEEKDDLFDVLLRVFDSSILVTHQSKYTQFIIFYMCQLKDQYAYKFVFDTLCAKLADNNCPSLLRQSATAYIGSFIGRANFMRPDVIKKVIIFLKNWIHQYLDLYSDSPPDCERHGIFYSITQSLLYIFCFKHTELEEMPNGMKFLQDLDFYRIAISKLNPLKLILPTVVREFSMICTRLGLVDCWPIIQQNRSIILPTKTSFGGSNELDSFFPFDPFLLKQSSRHFKNSYSFWKSTEFNADDETITNDEDLHSIQKDFDDLQVSPSCSSQLGYPSSYDDSGISVEPESFSWGDRSQFMVQDGPYIYEESAYT